MQIGHASKLFSQPSECSDDNAERSRLRRSWSESRLRAVSAKFVELWLSRNNGFPFEVGLSRSRFGNQQMTEDCYAQAICLNPGLSRLWQPGQSDS